MSKQRLWYYENAYKGRVLPSDLAITVTAPLERAGLALEEITINGLLPPGRQRGPQAVVPEDGSAEERLLQLLQEIRELLLEIRAGRPTGS